MMKFKSTKRAFVTMDLIISLAIFSILMLTVISFSILYEKNNLLSKKTQEMNYYNSCIIKELKYACNEGTINTIVDRNNYINSENIEQCAIENSLLINILEENIKNENKYIELSITRSMNGCFYKIQYVNKYYGDDFNYKIEGKI